MAAVFYPLNRRPGVFVWIAASALCPGQASVFPAVEFVAMAGGLVEFAFDTFQHVVATAASGVGAGCGGTMRTFAAAADEEQQGFRIGGLGQLSQKMGIEDPAGPGLPFDMQRPGNDAIEFEFCMGTYIDQAKKKNKQQQNKNKKKQKCAGKWPDIHLATMMGGVEQFG